MIVPNFKCGFSVYPPLQQTPDNIQRYSVFLQRITTNFSGRTDAMALSADKRILITPSTPRTNNASVSEDNTSAFYYFMLPGRPKIPADPKHCDHFLNFSLEFNPNADWERKIVEEYVAEVYHLFLDCFGDTVKLNYWHGLRRTLSNKQWGFYTPEDIARAEEDVKRLCQVKSRAERLALLRG
ncbi:set 5 [Fusarium heterosporum]|uniref:Set 5 n=1 Tax=Fusarium heterosporum TaxID=42747 RepID=A0A8H5TW84_FUSHE|nr:set 5 [Fusarium heterosporum]